MRINSSEYFFFDTIGGLHFGYLISLFKLMIKKAMEYDKMKFGISGRVGGETRWNQTQTLNFFDNSATKLPAFATQRLLLERFLPLLAVFIRRILIQNEKQYSCVGG
jgi:hypothetical protein